MDKKHPIQEILENDFKCRKYSGRSMYGKSCFAVVADNMFEIISAVIYGVDEDNRDEIASAFENARQDNMGLGTVIYFPRIEFVGDEDEDEEEEEEDE